MFLFHAPSENRSLYGKTCALCIFAPLITSDITCENKYHKWAPVKYHIASTYLPDYFSFTPVEACIPYIPHYGCPPNRNVLIRAFRSTNMSKIPKRNLVFQILPNLAPSHVEYPTSLSIYVNCIRLILFCLLVFTYLEFLVLSL